MSLVVRIIAPTGRDAELILTVLQQHRIAATVSHRAAELLKEGEEHPLGPLLIAQEALTTELTNVLRGFMQSQPPWSDIPILIVLRGGRERRAVKRDGDVLAFGLPVYLERPLSASTLVSSVRAALRARVRQYENRDAFLARDRALAELEQERAALIRSEKLAAVGRLAASISHEINNPLEAVTNLLYIARNTEGVAPEICDLLNTADEELRRVSQIVTHTLRFHRQSTNPRLITARELLEPTLGIYRGRLGDAGVSLELEHRGEIPILCFEADIRQVLNNLIANAIDSMRRGGRLLVRTGATTIGTSGAPALRITVADTGNGMTPETRKRLFEPFYTTKGINGTGLGLWISHGIVEKHKGLLEVRSCSRPGASGTVFRLVLPAEPGLDEASPALNE